MVQLPPMEPDNEITVTKEQIQEWYAKVNTMRATVLNLKRGIQQGQDSGVDWRHTMDSVIEGSAILQLQLTLLTAPDQETRVLVLDLIERIRTFQPTNLTV